MVWGRTLHLRWSFARLATPVDSVEGIHVHSASAGMNNPAIVVDLFPLTTLTQGGTAGHGNVTVDLMPEGLIRAADGRLYLNVHTRGMTKGEIRTQLWPVSGKELTVTGNVTGLEGRSGTLRGPVGAVKWRLFPPEVLGGWLPGAVAAVARRSQTAAAALSLTATVHPRLVLLRPVQEGRGGGTGERRCDRIRARLLSRWLPPPPRPPPPPQRAAFVGTWPPTTHETDGLSVVRVPIPAGIGRH